jgi:ATP-dependent Clp protease ATP-binding subunit ClpB
MEMKLEVSDSALMELAQQGFDPLYGARPLKRAIQQQIENPLAMEIFSGRFGRKYIIRGDMEDGRIVFEQVMEAEVV